VLAQQAQNSTAAGSVGPIVFWALVLAVLVAAMIVAALLVRRRVLGQDDTTVDRGTFSMAELRQLRDEGKMTEAEYERAKQALVARQLAQADSDKSSTPDSDNGSGATRSP
jgi:hypothetical protein